MEININVVNQKLRMATNLSTYVSGTQNFIKLTFNVDSSWDDLYPFAQFVQGNNTYNLYLDEDNSVYMPPEITPGECSVALYGFNNGVRATTNSLVLTIDESMLVVDSRSTDITPTLYEQLIARIDQMATIDEIATVAETRSYIGI